MAMAEDPKLEPAADAQDNYTEKEIDEALIESFPASDPPAWTLGHDPHAHPHQEDDRPKADAAKSGPERK